MTRAHDRPEFRTQDGTLRTWKLLHVEQRQPIALGGGQFHPNTTSCDRCGQCIRWVATMQGSDGAVLRTGMDCAESLAGGPSEMELRRAQRTFQLAQYRKIREAELAEAKAAREATFRVIAEENARAYGQVMAELAEVAASEKCSSWERDFAGRLLSTIREGRASGDLDMRDRASLRRALRTCRLPSAGHYGKVGDRVKNAEAILDRCVFMGHFDYGSRWALTFRLDSGEVLVWKTGTGSWCDELAGNKDEIDGTRVRLSFTIKQHSTFRGMQQTEISNAKVEGVGCGFFYANFDAETLRAPDFDTNLLQITWARNLEEVEARLPAGARIHGPFRDTTELYSAQREDAENNAMIDVLREGRAA